MSKFHSYLNTASGVIKSYGGDLPLSVFLKSFFSANKKYGSKDRKQITHICYCYFRLGKIINKSSVNSSDALLKQYMLAGIFICTDKPDLVLQALVPGWNDKVNLPVEEKFIFLRAEGLPVEIGDIFPWPEMLSNDINYQQFCKSFFIQPDLFLRIRPGYKSNVIKKLSNAQINFSVKDEEALALPNLTKIDDIVLPDEEVVVQDYSSQMVGEFLKPLKEHNKQLIKVWDCCAASGGKSILAIDYLGNIDLTVSDIRASILTNLQSRFRRAGITRYKSFIADLSKRNIPADSSGYNLVICDAPCSGSGTWSRTPEQLFFWAEGDIVRYTDLQNKITSNIVSFIKPGGYLLYITCSVFRNENEKIVEMIREKFNLELIQMNVIRGYNEKADTMFGALLRKNQE
ncbi:MAG: Fmu (Sun) domain-containing protein [Chitinophagaceae bacterium]|nr:Fmu (Sun) domain-containing protein [Chitinophagaceae bacterium]